MINNISKNILATIIYYDILDYPLTAFEIWKYLISCSVKHETKNEEKNTLGDIAAVLEKEDIKKYIEEYRGFYFIKGRSALIEERIKKNKISGRKLKIIKKIVFWLRFSPFLRMVAVTGRVSAKNAKEESDLDVLIVLKKNRIFIGRFFVTFATHILGKRRYADKIMNRICLNYFITDESLEINTEDVFSSSEYSFAIPVFGFEIFKKFQKKNNWIEKYKPNFIPDETPSSVIVQDSNFSRKVRKIMEIIFNSNWLEKTLKKWQMKRITADPRTYQKGSAVAASEDALVFLPEPQGPRVYERFAKRMKKLALD
jgi:hypothetical protein